MSKHRTEVLYLRVTPEIRQCLVKIADEAGCTISDAANVLLGQSMGIEAPAAVLARLVTDLARDTP